jgi:hypothetical protein
MQFKLGKTPPVFDRRTLLFGAYLKPTLPAPPPSTNYGAEVASWPMYDNDKYGDCTCAAAGHMIQNWTANAGHLSTPTDSSVLKFYEHFVGTPPPPDAGCNMLEVLKYWRAHGLGTHKITAFAALEPRNHTQAREAIYLFGSIYIGVALPNFTVPDDADPLTIPWRVPQKGPTGDAAPNPNNGHCIPAVGYDARNLHIITWGEVKTMSWQFYDAYTDEVYAGLSQEFIGPNKVTKAGFDFETLTADLRALG